MERLLLLFSDMNYGLVDSLMKEFEQKNSLMIPGDLRRKVNIFVSLVFHTVTPHLAAQFCSCYEVLV